MEAKRINFHRPILSTRRKDSRRRNESFIPALLPSLSYKSELHSDPLRNPGTVPFVWEQVPGTPKDETKIQKPHIVPSLPPGQILKPKTRDYDSYDGSSSSSSNGNGKVSRENENPQLTYGPNFSQSTYDDNEDDSDFGYDENENMSFKLCGLLPHFCLRGSIGLLNPTSGSSARTRWPISSAIKTRVSPSHATSQDTYDHKSSVKQQKDQNSSQSNGISDNLNDSSPPFVSKVNIQKKGLVSFKELLAYENEKEAVFENPTIEKTLYVDTVKTFESDFKENDVDILGVSHIPSEPFRFDLVADGSKHDKEMIKQTRDHKVDQKISVSQKTESWLLGPLPSPKSPSDSWLWRTLPSINSKSASLYSNHKLSSKETW